MTQVIQQLLPNQVLQAHRGGFDQAEGFVVDAADTLKLFPGSVLIRATGIGADAIEATHGLPRAVRSAGSPR